MEEEDTYYVAVVADQGWWILMQLTDSGGRTLHTFNPGSISPYDAAEYLSLLRSRLEIKAHTNIVEEQSFCDESVSLVVVEVAKKCSVSARYVWVYWEEACDNFEKSSCTPAVPAFLRTFLSQRGQETVRNKAKPWYSLGYYDGVFPWIKEAVEEAGHEITDTPEQWHFSAVSVVLRIPTDCGCLFFKASCKGSGEALRTQKIIELFPQHTAKLAKVNLELEATLTHDFGPRLSETCFVPLCKKPSVGYQDSVAIARSLLTQWAEFQQLSALHVEELIGFGLPVYDAEWMRNGFKDVLLYVEGSEHLSLNEQKLLSDCQSRLEKTFELLEKSPIPRTLVHGDLCSPNVAQPDGPGTPFVFFDWDSAFIGHPFLDLGDCEDYPIFSGESAYCESWTHFADSETIRKLVVWSKLLVNVVDAIVEMRKSGVWTEDEKIGLVTYPLKAFLKGVDNLGL